MKLQRLQYRWKSEITLKDIASVIHRKKVFLWKVHYARPSTPVDFAEGMRAVVKGKTM